MYGFVPSAGAVLGEWGAEVIKVEHAVTGDPQRGLRQTGPLRVEGDPNPNIEHANRGKRSIGLDMSVPEGKEVLLDLARRADVFLTSFLPGHRQKFGIDVDDIRAVNPKIIYARGSALGPRGEESVKGGYDMTAFWCRAGTAATITPPGIEGAGFDWYEVSNWSTPGGECLHNLGYWNGGQWWGAGPGAHGC